jgi:hypothetical protein
MTTLMKQIIEDHFDKLYLAVIFFICLLCVVFTSWLIPDASEEVLDYVKNSFVLGAIVGLVTGMSIRNGQPPKPPA